MVYDARVAWSELCSTAILNMFVSCILSCLARMLQQQVVSQQHANSAIIPIQYERSDAGKSAKQRMQCQ